LKQREFFHKGFLREIFAGKADSAGLIRAISRPPVMKKQNRPFAGAKGRFAKAVFQRLFHILHVEEAVELAQARGVAHLA
jgi:hypothetical protein